MNTTERTAFLHEIGVRIKKRREQLGLSQDEVATRLGYKSRSSINKIEMGINDIPQSKIKAIANALQTTPSYLMDGIEDTNSIIKTDPPSPSHYEYHYAPVGISAGTLEDVNAVGALEKISVPDVLMGRYAKDNTIMFMHVNGDSMNQIIEDGSLIAVKTQLEREQYKNGDIVVATNGRQYTIKCYYDDPAHRQFILTPNSTDTRFMPIICQYDEDDYRLVGRVVIYSVIL